MKKAKIGVCDADPEIQILLHRLLKEQGYEVVRLTSRELIGSVRQEQPHVLLLDDFKLCSLIRHHWGQLPVMVLSESTDVQHKVRALDLGADDYVTKPVREEELLARVRALLRRTHQSGNLSCWLSEAKMVISREEGIEIDVDLHCVLMRGQKVSMTPKEFGVLWNLVIHEGSVLPARELLRRVWGPEYGEESGHVLRFCVCSLRRKIETDPSQPRYLLTESGGYKFQSI